jgi:PadR family transcriptional regulator PadR
MEEPEKQYLPELTCQFLFYLSTQYLVVKGTVVYNVHMSQENQLENSKAQMRKGILEFCILLIIAQGRVYAGEILSELKKADLIVVEGTLYPLLSRLKSQGYLDHTWEESKSGPPRKYYTLTDKGKSFLKELRDTWSTLTKSIKSLS